MSKFKFEVKFEFESEETDEQCAWLDFTEQVVTSNASVESYIMDHCIIEKQCECGNYPLTDTGNCDKTCDGYKCTYGCGTCFGPKH
ncbi:MAG: hypothetical protein WC455_10585 [Dehalococcoidia bacterium]|jgi:hypothetical protein